jgi:fructosamine-3-kinase
MNNVALFVSNGEDLTSVEALPQGCKVISVKPHGETNWSVGHRVDVLVEEKTQSFFIKIFEREDAAEMALGEYESQKALFQYIPANTPPAIGWGTLESNPDIAFFVTEYRDLREALASPEVLADIMEKMHSTSVSPNGKFGFPVTTFKGYTPIENSWCDTWEEYFTRMFRNDIVWEQSVRGEDPEFTEVAEQFFQKVVPRLLRPLEGTIQPVLVHGDLWDGNVEFDMDTNKPIIFDACCCYGHRECGFLTVQVPGYIPCEDELISRS